MSWQDYEYGPADDITDHLIDEGWFAPDEVQDLYADRSRMTRTAFVAFCALLAVLVVVFGTAPAQAGSREQRDIERALRRGDAVLVTPGKSAVVPTRTRVRALMRRPTTVIVVPSRRRD